MENRARLILDPAVAGRSTAGVVYAGLTLRVDDKYFPDPEWTDFVVVVLSWWADAALRLASGAASSARIRFMEGPFQVRCAVASPQSWKLDCFEDGRQGLVIDALVDARPLVESLVKASDDALRLCSEREWWTNDADVLHSKTSALCEALPSFWVDSWARNPVDP
jgi:hypothetical protein